MYKRTVLLLVVIMLLICIVLPAEAGVSAGDNVTFGKYWQHMASDGIPANPEPIVWRVLTVEGNRVLLLAEQPLVGMPYNSTDHFLYEVTWENCSLRAWLNSTFLNEAFTSEEQSAILSVVNSTPDYEINGFIVSGGNDTTDKVFLLSTDELETYLKTTSSRLCCPTDYAVYTGASNSWGYYWDDSKDVDQYYYDVCMWWLRSPGEIGHYAAICDFLGDVIRDGKYVANEGYCVRPAVWVRSSVLSR